jgi:hypothetical protein
MPDYSCCFGLLGFFNCAAWIPKILVWHGKRQSAYTHSASFKSGVRDFRGPDRSQTENTVEMSLKKRLVHYCSTCSGANPRNFWLNLFETNGFRCFSRSLSLRAAFASVRPSTFSSASKHLPHPVNQLLSACSLKRSPTERERIGGRPQVISLVRFALIRT